jgi:2,5-diketo-D-gluconate reductase B
MQFVEANGARIPAVGLGTMTLKDAACVEIVQEALRVGYRHLDTAQMYGNEAEIGAALAQTDVKRADIHVTTKVSREFLAPDAMRRVAEESLRKLRLDYVDLYLIHWPAAGMDVQRAMESLMRLQAGGLAKHIGVSNFPVALMRRCIEEARAPIVCNQVEYHVMLDQTKVLAYARAHGIAVTAYCPLARGNLGEVEALARIARKHGATPAQIALKWLLDQDGVAAIPKASRAANQQENWDAQKIVLDGEDRAAIAALPKSRRIVNPAAGPKWDEAA